MEDLDAAAAKAALADVSANYEDACGLLSIILIAVNKNLGPPNKDNAEVSVVKVR